MNKKFEPYSRAAFFNQNAVCTVPASDWNGPRMDASATQRATRSSQDAVAKTTSSASQSNNTDDKLTANINLDIPMIKVKASDKTEYNLSLKFDLRNGKVELVQQLKTFKFFEFDFTLFFKFIDENYPLKLSNKVAIKWDPKQHKLKWDKFSFELCAQIESLIRSWIETDVDFSDYLDKPEIKLDTGISDENTFMVVSIGSKIKISKIISFINTILKNSESRLGTEIKVIDEIAVLKVTLKYELKFGTIFDISKRILQNSHDLNNAMLGLDEMDTDLKTEFVDPLNGEKITEKIKPSGQKIHTLAENLAVLRENFKTAFFDATKNKKYVSLKNNLSKFGNNLDSMLLKTKNVYGEASDALRELDNLATGLFQRMKSKLAGAMPKQISTILSRIVIGSAGFLSGVGAFVGVVEALLLIYDIIGILWSILPLLTDIFPYAIPQFIAMVHATSDFLRDQVTGKIGGIIENLNKNEQELITLKTSHENKLQNETQAIKDKIKVLEANAKESGKKIVAEEEHLNDPENRSPLDTSATGDKVPPSDAKLRQLNEDFNKIDADKRELQKQLVDIETPHQKKLESINKDLKESKQYGEKLKNYSVKFDAAMKLSDQHMDAMSKQKLPPVTDPETGLVPLPRGLKM